VNRDPDSDRRRPRSGTQGSSGGPRNTRGWEVVAEAEKGKDAVTKALASQPDVAIIDYSLPLINGVEATRQIRARLPNTQILIFTMFDNEMLVRDLLEAGARAYVVKSEANQYLIAAVKSLVNHKPFFVGRVSDELLQSYLTTRVHRDGSTLTPRERLVIYLVSEGHTNK